jgi:hypothetical protein
MSKKKKRPRLGELIQCPVCRNEVDPFIVSKYDAVRHIPARTVVQCPTETCPTIWYVPDYKLHVSDTA